MSFKKFLVAIAVVMLTATSVNAQEEFKNEIGISYGAVANSNFIEVIIDSFGSKSGSYFGPLGIEYFRHVNSVVGLGGIFVYKSHKLDVSHTDFTNSYITIMPAARFSWHTSDHFGFYSKLAAGYTFIRVSGDRDDVKDSSKNGSFNFQVSLVGLEAGSKQVRGFVELGWGEQGLALAGIRVKY